MAYALTGVLLIDRIPPCWLSDLKIPRGVQRRLELNISTDIS